MKKIQIYFSLVYKYFKRSILYFCCFACVYRNKLLKNKCNDKEILIISVQHMGESLMFLDGMRQIRDAFPAKEGYKIRFIGNANSVAFYADYGKLALDEYISLDKQWRLNSENISLLRCYRLYRYLRRYGVGSIICPFSTWWEVVISSWLGANKSYYLKIEFKNIKEMGVYRWLMYATFTNIIRLEGNEMLFLGYKKLMHTIGITNYRTQIGRIDKRQLCLSGFENRQRKYLVIVPGAQGKERRWGTGNYIQIIKHIFETTKFDVVLSGARDEINIGERIVKSFGDDERLVNMIGKTDLDGLVQIISNSRYVVGNDTGTIHLAAALGVPSCCLSSYKDEGRYHPYIVDIINEDDCVPEVLRAKLIPNCAGCNVTLDSSEEKIVWMNEDCRENVCNKGSLLCLDRISVDEVCEKIDQIL